MNYTAVDLATARKDGDIAEGVCFLWGLASKDGASFTLLREPHHTDDDLLRARAYLIRQRDVVGRIRVMLPAVDEKPWKVSIVFGEADSRRAAEGEWDTLESAPVTYTFDSEAELTAFMRGIDVAAGCLETYPLTEEELKEYREKKGVQS